MEEDLGCEEPICHFDFATEVPDWSWVLLRPVDFEELSREH